MEEKPKEPNENTSCESTEYLIQQENLIAVNLFHSVGSKIKLTLSAITVEPCLFLYLVALSLQSTLLTELILGKTCLVHYNFSKEICSNLSQYPAENTAVQQYTSELGFYITLIESLPTVIFILCLGSWSDIYGRKIPLLLPLFGALLNTGILIINVLQWSLPPKYLLLASIPKALTGGLVTLLMISYAYISDCSTVNNRTMRIAFIDIGFALGPLLGLLLSGVAYAKMGYLGVLCLSEGVTVICCLYVLLFVTETKGRHKGMVFWGFNQTPADTQELIGNPESSLGAFGYICAAFHTTFKQRPNYKRTKLLLLIGAMAVMVATYDVMSLEYLFTKKILNWNYWQYVRYLVFASGSIAIGIPILMPLLSRKLQISDLVLAIVGSFMKCIAFGLECFVVASWMMYAASVVGYLGFLPALVLRAAISKIVDEQETGKVFSIVACLEALVPLASKAVFTEVYNSTLDTFPGAIFLIVSAMQLFVVIVLLFVYFISRKELRVESERIAGT